MNKNKNEHGQALILIVAGMIAMFAMVGLAVDAGNAFSDRRHAQNAADTSALAAALALVSEQNWEVAGYDRASSNGYANDGVSNTVVVVNPPAAGCDGSVNGPYFGNDEYVQVVIRTNIDTFFAKIVGVNQFHNCVEAIAQAKPGAYVPFALGNAIAAMNCHDKWTIKSGGNSETITINGGVFSNSDNAHAFYINKLDNLDVTGTYGISAVGGIDYPSGYPLPIETGAEQIPCPLPDYWFPQSYTCDQTYEDFPDDSILNPITDEYDMLPGTTCITGSFKFPNKALNGYGVHIVLVNEGIHWNGNAELHLFAALGETDPLNGLLIYLPRPNSDSLVFNGTSDSEVTGTIFAPNSGIVLNGDYTGSAFTSQIIGATIDLTGGSNFTIDYNQGVNGGYTDPPSLELSK